MAARALVAVCAVVFLSGPWQSADERGGRFVVAAEQASAAPLAAAEVAPSASVDLAGRWLLTLPAGFQYRVTLEAAGEGSYRITGGLAFAGVYELQGEKLAMVEPVDKRMTVFDWTLHNGNSLTLVAETGASGARYVGATLGRQIDWDAAELPLRVVTPTRPAIRLARPLLRLPLNPAVRKDAEIRGKAFNDAERGPYIETADTIVFIKGLDAWPEDVLETTVLAKGVLRRERITDAGEALVIQVLDMESWERVAVAADTPAN
jgi:hypothetical protein